MFLRLNVHKNQLESLKKKKKNKPWIPLPQVWSFSFSRCQQGLSICISNKLTVNPDAVVPRTAF